MCVYVFIYTLMCAACSCAYNKYCFEDNATTTTTTNAFVRAVAISLLNDARRDCTHKTQRIGVANLR